MAEGESQDVGWERDGQGRRRSSTTAKTKCRVCAKQGAALQVTEETSAARRRGRPRRDHWSACGCPWESSGGVTHACARQTGRPSQQDGVWNRPRKLLVN